jgi:hypothetical protein
VLTLDEPDRAPDDAPWGVTATASFDERHHLHQLVGAVRAWFTYAARVPPKDPGPLYRAHGEPRD